MVITLRKMKVDDADFVLSIRNNLETRKYLHNSDTFTKDQFIKWFAENNPEWYIISSDGIDVGYIRSKWLDVKKTNLQVGIDIALEHRGKKIAFETYRHLEKKCHDKMIEKMSLEVLDSNPRGLALYEKLGFIQTGAYGHFNNFGSLFSIEMEKPIQNLTNKNLKIISCWFGDRRGDWQGKHGPTISLDMFQRIIKKEIELDKGIDCDTLFVVNDAEELHSDSVYQDCMSLVLSYNNTQTRNGRIMVETRPNKGLSFACFDYGFNKYCEDYDFFYFLEDDQVILKEHTLKNDIDKYKTLDNNAGFIATVGMDFAVEPHCHGACGVSSRNVLKIVNSKTYSETLKRNCLPHWDKDGPGAAGHEGAAEVPFTNLIYKSGYDLLDTDNKKFFVSWLANWLRNCHGEAERLVYWKENL